MLVHKIEHVHLSKLDNSKELQSIQNLVFSFEMNKLLKINENLLSNESALALVKYF